MKRFLASVAAVALMGGAATAQQVILVPQGQGSGGHQQFILVPVPQDQAAPRQGAGQQGQQGANQQSAGQQAAGEQQQARQRAEAMALDLYRRGYQKGIVDAQSAAGPALDPATMEQIGRELFERGYMLGLMQARAQIVAQETPQPGDDAQESSQGQAGAGQGDAGQGAAAQASAGQSGQQQAVTPEQIAGAAAGTPDAGQIGGQGDAAQSGQQQPVTPEQIAGAAAGTPDAGRIGGQGDAGQTAAAADQAQGATSPGQFPQAIIRTQSSEEFGRYLVDANGRPVYVLEADRQGEGDQTVESTCHDDCAAAWPPVLTQGAPARAMGDADEGMLSTTEREDGTMQVTYDGWPLYYYVRDEGANRPTGQDVHDEWGEWYLLQPNGEKVGEE